MKIRAVAPLFCGAVLLSSTGCQTVNRCCSSLFAARAATYADTTPIPEKSSTPPRPTDDATKEASFRRSDASTTDEASSQNKAAQPPALNRRFNIPEELPGADAAPLVLPPMDPSESIGHRKSLADALFPDIEPAKIDAGPGTDSTPLTLSTMQQMAVDNSPVIRQAAADVEQARGKAVQAGLYPNPTLGYQGDTIGTARTAGYNGVFFSQELVTADKLTLAQNVALNEVRAAQADLRKARVRLASDVRRNYFKVLIAQEQLKFNLAIAKLSEDVYQAQIDLVTGGESAPYEPLQLRVFAVQARNTVVTAGNALEAAWRQLSAAVGIPHMTRQRVTGSVDLPVPNVDYETLVNTLQRHSDLIAANARIAGSGCNLKLQEAVPIPNVTLYAAFQHDDTTPLSDYSTNVQVSAPVPAFNRNQGNITSAHAELVRARQNFAETNNTLMSLLAENYNRYATSRTIAESYRTDLLPDQVRVYRGVYDRFLIDGESIDFAQVVVAQQTLTQIVTSYLLSLSDSWMATVDLAELLQVDDLMTMDGMAVASEIPAETTAPDQSGTNATANSSEADVTLEANSISASETQSIADVIQDKRMPEIEQKAAEASPESEEPKPPLRSRRPRPRMIWNSEERSVQ